jgi:antirestriction protein ArdC
MSAMEKYNLLAEHVTREIIAGLEKGEVFWQRTWVGGGMPRNGQSGRYYEGFNALYLNYVTQQKHYTAPSFLTFQQAHHLGGHVKKGEKGYRIVFWKIGYYPAGEKEQEPGQPEAGLSRRSTPCIWTVFNVDQVEGISLVQPVREERNENEVIQACEEVIARMPGRPRILHGGHHAFYDEAGDCVQLPERNCFLSSPAYYSTLFHELIHSTGHPYRLNRGAGKSPKRGDEAYSREELVAEIGASFLNAHTGIKNDVFGNSLAYLKSWIKALKNDKTMILTASSKAAAACRYILDLEAAAQAQEEDVTTTDAFQTAA